MNENEVDRAAVVAWMAETGQAAPAAIAHFGLGVTARTVRRWVREAGEQNDTTPPGADVRRTSAADVRAEAGATDPLTDRSPDPDVEADVRTDVGSGHPSSGRPSARPVSAGEDGGPPGALDESGPDDERTSGHSSAGPMSAPDVRDLVLAELAANKEHTVQTVAAQFEVKRSQVRAWILDWAKANGAEPAVVGRRFHFPAGLIRRWTNRAARPQITAEAELVENQDGTLKASLHNFCQIVQHDEWWDDRLRYNEFSQRAEVQIDGEWVDLEDGHVREAALFMAAAWKVDFPLATVHEGCAWWADQHRVHPVRAYLRAIAWDGTPRLHRLLTDYLCCEHDDVSAAMGRKWAISAVARVMEPGCQVDTVLVLAGKQGRQKSSAFRALAGEGWFSDASMDLRSDDAPLLLQGAWVYEFGELETLRRSEVTQVKAFISRRTDRFRPKYGRLPVTMPRQCVLVGSTNEATFLPDSTGNRRFWVRRIRAGETIDLDKIRRDRDQLWAEAAHLYAHTRGQDFRWWLTEAERELADQGAREFELQHPWVDLLAGWLAAHPHDRPTTSDLLEHAVKVDMTRARQGDAKQVAAIMQQLGYRRERRTRDDRTRVWAPETTP